MSDAKGASGAVAQTQTQTQTQSGPPKPKSWFIPFITGGTAACVAETTTIPIDTAKVRLQLLNKGKAVLNAPTPGAAPPTGMVGTLVAIARDEGPLRLFKGLVPGLQRQLIFASLRLGLYDPIRNFYAYEFGGEEEGSGKSSMLVKVAAALTSGAIGITIANPTDLVKVRMQGDRGVGGKPRYSGTFNAYSTIIREEGVRGLWSGYASNLLRNSLTCAAELSTYDTAKEFLTGTMGLKEGTLVYALSAIICAGPATAIANPADVIKTRMMNAQAGQYRNILHCAGLTLMEGPATFYQGFLPQYVRIAGWNVVMFVVFEFLKGIAYTA